MSSERTLARRLALLVSVGFPVIAAQSTGASADPGATARPLPGFLLAPGAGVEGGELRSAQPPALPEIAAPKLSYPDLGELDKTDAVELALSGKAVTIADPKRAYGPSLAGRAPLDTSDFRLGEIAPAPAVARKPAQVAERPVAAGEGEGVESLRAAIIESLKSNPDIQIALARQDDARWGVSEASAGYFPRMDAAVALGGEFNDPQLGADTRLRRGEGLLSIQQNVWDFGTTINEVKRARAAYRSAQWGTREKIEAISYEISAAYLSVLERQKLLGLAEQELAAHEKILKMVTTQNELGLTTAADVSRVKARLQNVQAQIQDRKSQLEQAREAYRRLTDHLPGLAVEVPPVATAMPADADAAVGLIDDRNPRMAQAVADRRSIERQRASQTGTFFPKVGLLAQANWRDDVQGLTGRNRDARAMVTMTYSFLNGGADVAVRNRLSARLREADYEVDRRRREVEQDIRIDFNALEAARAKMSTIEGEIASSEKVVQLYNQQFREGKRTVFDLLDSQQILFNARASAVTNGTAKTLAEYRVLQQLGGLFDHLSEGQKMPKLAVPAPGRRK